MSRTMLDELQARRLGLFNELSQSDTEADRYSDLAARHRDIAAGIRQKIADLDKAISALTPEGKEALLDDQPEPIPTEVRKQDEQDAAGDWKPGDKKPWTLISAYRDGYEGRKQVAPHHHVYMHEYKIGAAAKESNADIPPAQEAPAIPEGGTQESELTEFLQKDGAVEHSGGPCPVPSNWVVEVLTRGCGIWPLKNIDQIGAIWWWEGEEAHPTNIVAYRIIKASADAERIEDARDGTPSTEQTEHDRPKLTNEEFESLEKIAEYFVDQPTALISEENEAQSASETPVSSTVFLDQAEAAINDKSEDEPATPEQLEAAGITERGASELAAMRTAQEPKRINIFGTEFGGGAKKTLVGGW